jgi:hypothetical protein
VPPLPRYRILITLSFVALSVSGWIVPAPAEALPELTTATTSIPAPQATAFAAQATPMAAFPNTDTFKLHSYPGADRVIYLDFNGETVANSAWNNAHTNGNPFTAIAFDADGNPGSFSDGEHATIQETWQRVAEDYAPFAVDVTTEDPGLAAIDRAGASDPFYGTRALITNTSTIQSSCGCSGVAYVGAFPVDSGHQFYQPAFIFGQTLGNAKDLADATSHEVGHTLGLKHDGKSSSDYYFGQGAWAPIMGGGYYCPVTQFSKGDYTGATNTEDDFAVMQQYGAPLRSDDHSDTTAGATPFSAGTTASGIIRSDADVDVFAVSAPGGSLGFTATPAPKGPNLDIKLELLDASGAVVSMDNPPAAHPNGSNPDYVTGLGATVNASVPAGNYFVRVQGVGSGDATTGYSGYGSVGRYTLSGSSTGGGGTPALSVGDANISEGNAGSTNVTFTVSLSAASASPVSVNVGTSNGTGLAGSDYTAASGVVTIPAGQTSTAFTVNAAGDTAPEPHEKFSLVLSNPSGATIADSTGAATLVNDDGVGIKISDVAKLEGSGGKTTLFTFTVTLSTVPSWAIGVTVKTAPGSAVAGDFVAKTQTLNFSAGQKSKTFTVTVKGDGTKEANETFFVNLSNPTGSGAKVTDSQGVGTIKNDD